MKKRQEITEASVRDALGDYNQTDRRLVKVESSENIADIFTKRLPPRLFYKHRDSLGLETKAALPGHYFCTDMCLLRHLWWLFTQVGTFKIAALFRHLEV